MTTAARKGVAARYENIELNEDFGPITELVDDYAVKKCAFVTDDYNPWYFEQSPFSRRIAHAGILANDLLQLFTQVYDPNTVVGLHTHEELWFVNPIVVPERVRLYGKYVEKYERRGKGYVVMEADARGEDGRVLVRHRGIEILHIEPSSVVGKGTAEQPEKRVTGEYRKDVEPAPRAVRGLLPGTPLVPLHKQPRQDQIAVFSMVAKNFRNIHTDIEVARRAGLPTTLAQGQMETVYLTELLTTFFGASWFTTGWQKVKFIRPVYCGDRLKVCGVVSQERQQDGDTILDLDIWAENEKGEMTAAGWASGRVDANL